MERFLKDNEMQNNENLSSLVVPKDELSDQVLDLLAGLKAREETVRQLESKFNEKEIPLELFMKMFYKL